MIHQINPTLYVGDSLAPVEVPSGTSILHATKTWHREFVGYETYACPKDCPEYLFAQRGHEMALNMVDGVRPNNVMVQAGLRFLHREAAKGRPVLIHCNEGKSRAPMMAMLYTSTLYPVVTDFEIEYPAWKACFQTLYPPMQMHPKLERFLMENWSMPYDLHT
jgi:hypothetical protein